MKKVFCAVATTLCAFYVNAQSFITNNGISINNSAVVTTNGDWTNASGTNIIHNGKFVLTENFTNAGTLDPSSNGSFILNFATNKNFQPGGSKIKSLTKTGAGSALVTGTLSIKDSLLLNNGIVQLINATDTVSVRTGGIVMASPTSWVQGLVARAGSGDLVFPLGRDGMSLPLKLYKAQAKKITASVNPAGFHAKGPGVVALIAFPYQYKVDEQLAADTAAYVEINYPNSLPFVANAIVVREMKDTIFASMGARFISNSGGRVTVRSYSRRLKGIYSIAQGFPADLVTDSLALVALYNSTRGTTWTTRTNWLSGDVDTWAGVTVNGQSITALNLASNNLDGPVPDPVVDIQALQTVNLSGNKLTAIPNFTSNNQITSLNVSNNRLDFGSLEPNATVPGLIYTTQADFGKAIDSLVSVGSYYEFKVNAGGASSQYTWKRNGTIVPGATSPVYALAPINRSNMGDYVSEVTNPLLPNLTLKSTLQRTRAYANVAGKLLAEPGVNATKGEVTLFRITTSAYDTIGIKNIANDGSFQFEKVVLDDYQLLGFADTLTHERSLPTYYKNTILWEEADTIKLQTNVNNLDITSEREPGPPAGQGSISGYLEEDDGTGRVMKPKRVAGAGVAARRVESSGRAQAEILTLVAYVFTNELGEFNFPDLPVGQYRINIQYPGYPMDETSFVTIPIGTGLQSQVSVAANVTEEGKINVKKRIITGFLEDNTYNIQLYPNPAVDFVKIGFEQPVNGRNVVLMDATGKTVIASPAEAKEVSLNVQSVSKGMYFLRVKENDRTVTTLKVSIE